MVARNGDTIELRHVLGCIRKDITDNTHGRSWRVNIGITYHELFQNIILNCTSHNLFIYALFFTSQDVERHYWQYGAVHCHGYGHLIKRDTRE